MRILLVTIMFFVTNVAIATDKFEAEKCIQTLERTCIEQGEKVIDGFKVNKCWKYEERFKCIGKEENHCSSFEQNRGCNQTQAKCLEESETGICKVFEKQFICGSKTNETEEIKLINTEFETTKDEKDLSSCNPHEIDKYCTLESEICVEKGETRNINGKDIYKDCWRWDRKYTCRTNTKIDECKELKAKCTEVKRECIHEEEGRCEHFVVEYQCVEKAIKEVDCTGMKFCIGGVCKEQKRNVNNNFGTAISYLKILSSFKTDAENCTCDESKNPNCQATIQNTCRIFKGTGDKCRRYTGMFNCCKVKGFFVDMAGCKENEKELRDKRRAKLCHYVATWKGKRFKKFKKKQIFCCFNSKLARMIQEGGRRQLGISWGDKNNPDCRGLTLAEMQRIDFSKIDMSDISHEIAAKANKRFESKAQQLKKKFENLKQNPSTTSGKMLSKMKNFKEKHEK